MTRSKTIAVLASGVALLLATGCASDTTTQPNNDVSPSATVTASDLSASPSPESSPTESIASNEPSPSEDLDTATPTPTDLEMGQTSESSSAETPPVVLDESRSGQELGLQDFPFRDPEWTDGVFSVDGAQVTGIATFLDGCSSYSGKTLQMRLGKRFKKLTFMVGQGDNSQGQKDKVLVKIEASGRPITPKSVPFTTPTEFEVDTTGVNGLEMTFVLDDNVQDCGTKGKIQTVVYKIVATK